MEREEIIRQAMQLGEVIADSEVLTRLRDKQMQLAEHAEAYSMLLRFQEAQMNLEHKLNAGEILDPNEEHALDEMEQALTNQPVVQELMKAQEEFDGLMQGVYFAINQMVTGTGNCAGGCDGCAGC